jgi:hypothetical protein
MQALVNVPFACVGFGILMSLDGILARFAVVLRYEYNTVNAETEAFAKLQVVPRSVGLNVADQIFHDGTRNKLRWTFR